jgi:hypothetical protein
MRFVMNWPRPKQILVKCGRQWPTLWKYVDLARAERGGKLPKWPTWCYLPTTAGLFLIQHVSPFGTESSQARSFDSAESFSRMVVPLATWRVTQGIYRIDSDVAEAIWNTPIEGQLPVELLFHLPEWCVYIETPGRILSTGKRLEGFFAHLNLGSGYDAPELHLLLDDPSGVLHSIAVSLSASTLEEACRLASVDRANYEQKISWSSGSAVKIADEQLVAANPLAAAAGLAPLISMLLYLCSESADYRDSAAMRDAPRRPNPVQTRNGLRIFPPDVPTVWETGYRMGAPLRSAMRQTAFRNAGANRSSPVPHIRRAHWHSFWLGPRANIGERRLALRWLPPIPVALSTPEELVPAVRQVS